MKQNKTTKYFKYAIGEIVLVVIGILIALQINNWNERRLEAYRENITLSNLNEEFRDNLNDLDSTEVILSNTINSLEQLFGMFNEEEGLYNSRTVDSIIATGLTSPSWKPSEFVLNDLKSSGGLSKLRNAKLKKLLFGWTRFYNQMKETVTQTEKTSIDVINFLKLNGSLRNTDVTSDVFNYKRSTLNIDNVKLLQNHQFENHIDDKLFVLNEAKNQYKTAKELINQILKETALKQER
jgi:hypothetical protein